MRKKLFQFSTLSLEAAISIYMKQNWNGHALNYIFTSIDRSQFIATKLHASFRANLSYKLLHFDEEHNLKIKTI